MWRRDKFRNGNERDIWCSVCLTFIQLYGDQKSNIERPCNTYVVVSFLNV